MEALGAFAKATSAALKPDDGEVCSCLDVMMRVQLCRRTLGVRGEGVLKTQK